MQVSPIPQNTKDITHSVSRFVITPTILTVPKYAALKGDVVIIVLSVMDTELLKPRINLDFQDFSFGAFRMRSKK